MTDEVRTGISSVEIRTTTRGTDVSVKVYQGSPLGDIGDHGRGRVRAARALRSRNAG